MTVAQIIAQDGSEPILTAPTHIRGRLCRWTSPNVRAERKAWAAEASLQGHTQREIAAALGITQAAVSELGLKRPRSATRAALHARGIALGSVEGAIQSMSLADFAALERTAARKGKTMAQALVDHWTETHA